MARICYTCYFFLGLFQYGDLHLGHTIGSSEFLGTHSWLHRSHLKPSTVSLTFILPPWYILMQYISMSGIILGVSYIYLRGIYLLSNILDKEVNV